MTDKKLVDIINAGFSIEFKSQHNNHYKDTILLTLSDQSGNGYYEWISLYPDKVLNPYVKIDVIDYHLDKMMEISLEKRKIKS